MIRRLWHGLPPLVRFMIVHAATGAAVGWGLLLVLIRLDAIGLGALLANSPDGGLATALLAALFAITFGAVGIGLAVMTQPWRED